MGTTKAKATGFKRTILAVSVALSGLFASSANAADISSQLDSMFGSMSNTTSAGDYHSITRDGYTGGICATQQTANTYACSD